VKLRPSFFILFVGFFTAIFITFLIVVFFHVLSMIISHPSFLDTPLSEFEGLLEDARGLYWSDPLGGIISVLTFVVGGFAVLILYLTKPVWRRMQVIDMAGYSVVISLLLFGAFLELPYALMSIWFNFPLKIDLVVLAIVFLAIVGLVRFFLGLRDRFKLAGFIAMVLIPLISLPGLAISSKITGHLPEAMRHIPLRAAAVLDGVFTHIVLKEICESSPQRCDNTYLGVVRFEDRGGSVCLNNFRTADKWISAPVMPRPGLVAAR